MLHLMCQNALQALACLMWQGSPYGAPEEGRTFRPAPLQTLNVSRLPTAEHLAHGASRKITKPAQMAGSVIYTWQGSNL